MNYPLISEYIESIKSAEDNFNELSYLRPVLDDDGLPVMTSGNFAVVFKTKDERDGKLYAVKCFTKEQEGRNESYKLIADELKDIDSPYIVPIKYLVKELFVDSKQTDETEFPVLLMDWVDGKTLDKYLRENLDDKYALEMLAYRFSQLAQWLIPQPYAHGDLKPDNILVREDGTLVLVDYDGMYVPAMKGQKARELGSPDFRHPLRTEDDFDEHIDDFPLVSILLSLKAISLKPQLMEMNETSDKLLFSENDYRCISDSVVGLEMLLFLKSEDCRTIMSVFLLCLKSRILPISFCKYLYVYFEGLNYDQYALLPSELKETISKAIIGDMVEQESIGYKFYYGEGLCRDYTKAFYWYKASATHGYPLALYNIGICYQQGTGVSQNYQEAFKWFLKAAEKGDADAQYNVGVYYKNSKYGIGVDYKESVRWLIEAVKQGEESAQKRIEDIYEDIALNGIVNDFIINIDTSDIFKSFKRLAEQGNQYGQYNLGLCYWEGYGIECNPNEALKWYELAAKQGNKKAQSKIKEWGYYWYDGNKAIYSKDKHTILGLRSLYTNEYEILEGTESVAENAFCDLGNEMDCSYLDKIIIPSSVKSIGHSPFNKYLSEIICYSSFFEVDNNTLYSKGKRRLIQCLAKTEEFVVPNEVELIDDHAFYGCKSKKIIIPDSVQKMGINPFIEMDTDNNTLEIISYSSKFVIDNDALYEDNRKLISYWGKDDSFSVPNGIKAIGEYAFFASNLKTINMPDTIDYIGDCAFGWCLSLEHVLAPSSSAEKFKRIMDGYQDMIRIEGE